MCCCERLATGCYEGSLDVMIYSIMWSFQGLLQVRGYTGDYKGFDVVPA